ncbi:hypothetical protein [Aurantiacibacter odishensis]|uniref:hypothetical protein n=1 Tax=Aurantiacibacter odishensis TaxID=1155476 RepID=UPI000E75E0CB|nr:hypothetical protein [Aurantiacibacter odishensis]
MTYGSDRNSLSTRLLGLAYACAAALGVFVGVGMALQLPGRPMPAAPEYVQRVILPNTPPEFAIRPEDLPGADEGTSATGSADETLAAASDLQNAGTQRVNGDLRRAMEGFAAEGPPATLADGRPVMRVDFDLGATPSADDMVEVPKAIRLNGRALGQVKLSIDRQSRLHLSRSELSTLLPSDLYARLEGGAEFIDFDELRREGLDISYDPLADTVEIVS